MSDDESLNEALCALTQLTDEQLDGLAALSAMETDGMDEFGRRVEEAWDGNQRAVTDARRAVEAAMRERIDIETECGKAARVRWAATGGTGQPRLTNEEAARCWAARDRWLAAKEAAADAIDRFKQGVTAEQLAGVD